MKVFRLNKNAERPKFPRHEDAFFNIKSCLELNGKVKILNPLNKETYTPVRSMGGKVAVQVYPQQRILIPTGLIFDIPKDCVLRLHSSEDLVMAKGLVLANSTELVKSDYKKEVFVMVYNITDAVAVIENGESIAQGQLEKMHSYSITEIDEMPEEWQQ